MDWLHVMDIGPRREPPPWNGKTPTGRFPFLGVAAYFYGGVLSMAATMPRYGANQEARCRTIFKAMRTSGCRPP
eukprot:6459335-Amphidinium_carterae.1